METNSPPARMRPSVGEWLVTLGSPWFIVYPRLDCNIPGGSREEPSQIHNPKDFSSQVERYLTHNSYDSDMRSGQSSWLVVQWWVYLFSQEIYNIDVKHGNQPALCIPVLFLCETMKGTPFVPYCSYRFNIEHGESWFHPVWNDVNTHIASSDLPKFFHTFFPGAETWKFTIQLHRAGNARVFGLCGALFLGGRDGGGGAQPWELPGAARCQSEISRIRRNWMFAQFAEKPYIWGSARIRFLRFRSKHGDQSRKPTEMGHINRRGIEFPVQDHWSYWRRVNLS